jgi:hypothetical protein
LEKKEKQTCKIQKKRGGGPKKMLGKKKERQNKNK